jgi:putative ABC transport system permease protein
MGQDIRYAIRSWLARPAAALAAIATLAIGVGAGAAIFTMAHALLVQPVPYPAPDQLVVALDRPLQFGATLRVTPSFLARPEIAAAGFMQAGGVNLDRGGQSERLRAAVVDDGFFRVMAVPPAVGETLPPPDGVTRRVVLSWGLWRSRFGAARSVVGEQLTLNGRAYDVAGVMPPGFAFPDDTDVWIPAGVDFQATGTTFSPDVIARVSPGMTVERANAALLAGQSTVDSPEDRLLGLEPLGRALTQPVRPTLVLLTISVGVLLLAACVSLANMLLARVTARSQELSVRRALGASGWRLARQLLTESLLMSIIGGGIGLLGAFWAIAAMTRLSTASGVAVPSGLGLRVALLAALLSVVVAIVMSIAPGLIAGASVRGTVRSGRGHVGPGRQMAQRGLVVIQIALALVLLTASAAAVQALVRASHIELGFGNSRTFGASVTLPMAQFPITRVSPFVDDVLARLTASAEVIRAGATGMLPGSADVGAGFRIVVPGHTQAEPVFASYLAASPDYFAVMGIRVIAGRALSTMDRRGAPPVIVVSESTARRLFARPEDAVGAAVELASPRGSRPYTVVGVVADVMMKGLEADPRRRSQMYVPIDQEPPFGTLSFVVEMELDVTATAALVARAVADVDAAVPVYHVHALDDVIDRYLRGHRMSGWVVSAFALVTLLVAAVGLYGLVSHTVVSRLHDLGIRLALGADAGRLRRRFVWQALMLAGGGLAIGGVVSALGLRLLASVTPELTPPSLQMTIACVSVLLGTTVLAAWWPTAVVTRLDPSMVLREG